MHQLSCILRPRCEKKKIADFSGLYMVTLWAPVLCDASFDYTVILHRLMKLVEKSVLMKLTKIDM